jgi:two-component system, response regulator PhcR
MTGSTAAVRVPGGPGTVLFVDDEPHACKWFARLFSDEFPIITAGGVDEALVLLAERGADIAVLVTDYRMPVRDGLALLNVAQRDHRNVVRLLATAYAEKDVALAAINQGRVLQIIEKPFDEAQVRSVLRGALESCRERERERALADNRAAAMRETLGFLAHELNTPLATVLGYMDALKRRLGEDERGAWPVAPDESVSPASVAAATAAAQSANTSIDRRRNTLSMVDAAERRTQYALSLVATFVQSARDAYPGAAAPARLQASRLVRALLDGYPFEHHERGWVTDELDADFELPGQRDLLYLVLCTLTKNALLALKGRAEPRLTVTLENPRDDAGQPLHAICFTDNGPGIAPDILARLTREPVTTRAAQGGSGMGLLFCRRVVQSMGGQIEVHSGQGRGTRVMLLFKPEKNIEKVE